MSPSQSRTAFQFPAGTLAPESLSIPLLARERGWMALNKPAGPATRADPLDAGRPVLWDVFRRWIAEGNPELHSRAIREIHPVNFPSGEVSGVALAAVCKETHAVLRNAMGSMRFSFVYCFAASGTAPGSPAFTCDLPLARHRELPRMLVSHKTGKKTVTHFRLLRSFGEVSLWEAASSYDRPHQVRLHAQESGLGILGESLYASIPVPALSDLKQHFKGTVEGKPLYDGICLHLHRLSFPDPVEGGSIELEAPFSPRFSRLLFNLERYGSGRGSSREVRHGRADGHGFSLRQDQ